MWPRFYDKESKNVYDLPSRLLKDRIIFLNEEIDDDVSGSIVAQLLTLEAESPDLPITIYINSPGGSISAGFAIYDVMNNISCPIITIANGMAASMAAFLLSAGSKGKRYAMPNSSIMIHQPLGAARGQATDIEIVAKRIVGLKQRLTTLLAQNCGQTYKKMYAACERDNYLSAEAALKLGIIDEIIKVKPEAFAVE